MQNTISSKKAAQVLNVNESTVKRWADNNILKCIKTAGGHRKFFLEEIINHAASQELQTSLLSKDKFNVRVRQFIRKRSYNALSETLENFLLKGDAGSSYNLLYSLYFSNYKLEDIFDAIVKAAMENIGKKWKSKIIEIGNEHIASNTLISSLYQFEKSIIPGKLNGLTAVCTAMEKEGHGIGLLCVRIILQKLGYKIIYPGINLPLKSLVHLIDEHNPTIVCISTTLKENNEKLIKEVKILNKKSEGRDIAVFVGGQNINSLKTPEHFFCNSTRELVRKIKSKTK